MTTIRKILIGLVAAFALLIAIVVIAVVTNPAGTSNTTTTTVTVAATTTLATTTTTTTATTTSTPQPDFVLVPRQSSCQESPSRAYVNCSIGVRNKGSAAGVPTVYVFYRYSDSGTTIDSSQDAIDRGDSPSSDPIQPHTLGYVYFSHPYKATDHDLIQAAASLDENAKQYPYVRVVDPSDANWPAS